LDGIAIHAILTDGEAFEFFPRPPNPSAEELKACTTAELKALQNEAQQSTRMAYLFLTLNDKLRRRLTEESLHRQTETEKNMGPFVEIIKRTIHITRHAQVPCPLPPMLRVLLI
jgi:hypothetical protein